MGTIFSLGLRLPAGGLGPRWWINLLGCRAGDTKSPGSRDYRGFFGLFLDALAPEGKLSPDLHRAMIVAVVAVWVVQMVGHQIIHVVAVRHLGMAAIRTMHMGFRMPGAGVLRRASGSVGGGHSQSMLVHMGVVDMVQVAVMQVIDVSIMLDPRVAATRTMLMVVSGMNLASSLWHGGSSSWCVAGLHSPLDGR